MIRTAVVMGLPGCVMYAKRTILIWSCRELWQMTQVTAEELAALGLKAVA